MLRGLFFQAWGSLTSFNSLTRDSRLKVPPGKLVIRVFTYIMLLDYQHYQYIRRFLGSCKFDFSIDFFNKRNDYLNEEWDKYSKSISIRTVICSFPTTLRQIQGNLRLQLYTTCCLWSQGLRPKMLNAWYGGATKEV